MAIASRLGPWLLGTVKTTTGTAIGTVRNMGATSVGQVDQMVYSDPANTFSMVIPAGAIITQMQVITPVAFSSAATIVLSVLGTAITASATITSVGASVPLVLNAAGAVWAANVGSIDSTITYTISGTTLTSGSAVLLVEYLVRNPDGTYTSNSFTS